MKYYQHAFINGTVGVAAIELFNPSHPLIFLLSFIAGGLVIDSDHILYSMIKGKTLNLRKIFQAEKKYYEANSQRFLPFHHLETGSLLTFLSLGHAFLLQFTLGYWLHVVFDWIRQFRIRHNFTFIPEWSIVYKIFHR